MFVALGRGEASGEVAWSCDIVAGRLLLWEAEKLQGWPSHVI